MRLYPAFFRLVFSRMDAERAHAIGFTLIRLAGDCGAGRVLRRLCRPPVVLRTEALGMVFPSPFGLAAGFDKRGHGISALTDLGFGHIEVGTITGQAQPGNATPRLFRLIEDRAVINRMGFNNDGALAVAPRVASARRKLESLYGSNRPIVGLNIGKTKTVDLADAISDYLVSTRELAPHADYLVVNVSSPNTPGLRQLQDIASLKPLLEQVRETATRTAKRRIPLLVKIAPDLSDEDIRDVADLAVQLQLDGIVATNTTVSRTNLETSVQDVQKAGDGGLSGAPLAQRSLEVLKQLRATVGPNLVLISVGGVETAYDVQERLDAGATLVQGYTAFLYEGPLWARTINKTLAAARS